MTVHEFGDKSSPVIMLFPGTACYWKGNFGHVIDELSKSFLVASVAYTGFDESDRESYTTVSDELEKIEGYILGNYGGRIHASYGCSLGGTFVAHIAARHNIHMKYGIIGASALDIPSKRCYFCRKGGSNLRRSRLKIFLLYFAPQFSVYTKFGIDPSFSVFTPATGALWSKKYACDRISFLTQSPLCTHAQGAY